MRPSALETTLWATTTHVAGARARGRAAISAARSSPGPDLGQPDERLGRAASKAAEAAEHPAGVGGVPVPVGRARAAAPRGPPTVSTSSPSDGTSSTLDRAPGGLRRRSTWRSPRAGAEGGRDDVRRGEDERVGARRRGGRGPRRAAGSGRGGALEQRVELRRGRARGCRRGRAARGGRRGRAPRAMPSSAAAEWRRPRRVGDDVGVVAVGERLDGEVAGHDEHLVDLLRRGAGRRARR